jgi:release factor glutamine methyltransferase
MLTIQCNPHVYGPREDSYLLLDVLLHESLSGRGLEMGIGTGIIALHVSDRFDEFIGVDISPQAVALTLQNAHLNAVDMDVVHFYESDLFSQVQGVFDVIICNPPYVPADEKQETIEDLSYHGGEDGRQFLDRFLRAMPSFLAPRGVSYVLQSSLTGMEKTETLLEKTGFSCEISGKKKLFFEELMVIKVSREEFHDET